MSNKKLTGTLIPKDNKKAKMHATFYSDKPIGSGGDSEIFDEYIDATDQQRNIALANVSNQTANSTTGKMGYKVLDGSKSFASQVAAENTIYEIRDVFDLGGTQETPVSVTLPAGSTLKFNGGIIKNCTLQCSLTQIQDDVSFDNVVITGSVKNTELKLSWWKIDNSNVSDLSNNNTQLNCLLSSSVNVGKTAVIDRNIRVSSTFTATESLLCFGGSIYYYGEQTIQGGVLTLKGSRKNFRISIYNSSDSGNFETRSALAIAGVTIDSCYMCDIYIDEIYNFTHNILIDCTVNASSYDNFYIKRLRSGYKNLCIKLANSGWFTESRFFGGRFQTDSNSIFNGHSIAIAIEGIGTACNNLVFENQCIEGSNIGIYAKETEFTNCKFNNIRNEAVQNLIYEDNVNVIYTIYQNIVTVYRFNADIYTNAVYRLFKIIPNENTERTAIWDLECVKSERGSYYFAYPMASYTTPSGKMYLKLANYGENVVESGEDLSISSGYGGAGFMLQHSGFIDSYIKCDKGSVVNSLFVFIVEKTVSGTSGYKALTDLSDINIMSNGIAKMTTDYPRFLLSPSSELNGKKILQFSLKNIPVNTYVFVIVQGSLKHIEYIERSGAVFVNEGYKGIKYLNSKPIAFFGNKPFSITYYDNSIKSMARAAIATNGTITYTNPQGYTAALTRGDTASRPTNLTTDDFGFEYADSDLGKKIMWSGTAWVNLDGTALS